MKALTHGLAFTGPVRLVGWNRRDLPSYDWRLRVMGPDAAVSGNLAFDIFCIVPQHFYFPADVPLFEWAMLRVKGRYRDIFVWDY